MRSQHIVSKKTGNRILLDAYNANPSSMPVAIDAFLENATAKGDGTKKPAKGAAANGIPYTIPFMILGDMRELGKETETEHEKLIKFAEKKAKAAGARIVFIGEELTKAMMQQSKSNKAEKDPAAALSFFFKTKEDFLKSETLKNMQDKTKPAYIFVKGSRGMKLEDLVESL